MEDKNEIMTVENEEIMEPEETVEEDSGMGFGGGLVLGSLLTLAGIAGFRKLKRIYDERKARKEEAEQSDDSKVIDITDQVQEDVELKL